MIAVFLVVFDTVFFVVAGFFEVGGLVDDADPEDARPEAPPVAAFVVFFVTGDFVVEAPVFLETCFDVLVVFFFVATDFERLGEAFFVTFLVDDFAGDLDVDFLVTFFVTDFVAAPEALVDLVTFAFLLTLATLLDFVVVFFEAAPLVLVVFDVGFDTVLAAFLETFFLEEVLDEVLEEVGDVGFAERFAGDVLLTFVVFLVTETVFLAVGLDAFLAAFFPVGLATRDVERRDADFFDAAESDLDDDDFATAATASLKE